MQGSWKRFAAAIALLFAGCSNKQLAIEDQADGAEAAANEIPVVRISDTAFEFPALAPPEAEPGASADITNIPIDVWVERDASGAIRAIRVTGHATEYVCAQASLALLEFQGDQTTADGFLSYGVGELRPASDQAARAFADKAEGLVQELTKLGQETGYVVIHAVSAFADTPPVPDAASSNTKFAVHRHQPASSGPGFIPLRTWSPGKTPQPVIFEFDKSELGSLAGLVDHLSREAPWAPIAELIERSKDRIARIRRLQSRIESGARMDDGVVAFYEQTEFRSPSPEELTEALDVMINYARKYDALSLMPIGEGLGSDLAVRREIREIEQAILVNEACRSRLARGSACGYFVSVRVRPPDAEGRKLAKAIDRLMAKLEKSPPEVFEDAITEQEGEIHKLERMLRIRKQSSRLRTTHFRETVLDGLLRGWPLPTSDDTIAMKIDTAQGDWIPALWMYTLDQYASNGTDLREPYLVTGVQERANVFYRVHQDSYKSFSVAPTYVVLGDYLEVWDPVNQRVTIEQPGANQFEPDFVTEAG